MHHRMMKFMSEVLLCENVKLNGSSEWITASCPKAPWTHDSGDDRNPSFGIHLDPNNPGAMPSYNCFTCGSGSLASLVHSLTWLRGASLPGASEFLSQFSFEDDSEENVDKKRISFFREIPPEVMVPDTIAYVDDDALAKLPLLSCEDSLETRYAVDWLMDTRKISEDAIRDFHLRLFSNSAGNIGVVFPIVRRNCRVCDLFVRMIDEKKFFRLTPKLIGSKCDYSGKHALFGEHLVEPGSVIVVVEGALDALRLYSLGVRNVVASLGPLSRSRASSLLSSFVVLAFDADTAGVKMTSDAVRMLGRQSRVVCVADWSIVGKKDPGEIDTIEQALEVLSIGKMKVIHF